MDRKSRACSLCTCSRNKLTYYCSYINSCNTISRIGINQPEQLHPYFLTNIGIVTLKVILKVNKEMLSLEKQEEF